MKETDSNLVFGVEWAVIMKRVKTEGEKEGDFDMLCILIVPLIRPGGAAFPAHPGFYCAQHEH
jgi:hypothetical protein